MQTLTALASFIGAVHGFVAPVSQLTSAQSLVKMQASFGQDDLKALATEQNPVIGYFDPWKMGERDFWESNEGYLGGVAGNEASIAWLRHAEIKHGRVAMFGFVGYCVHANGITWPWAMTTAGDPFPKVSNAADAWDALPLNAQLQIVGVIGFLELWGEASGKLGEEPHYMRGGKPGSFPSFDALPHPVPFNLYDPFKLSAKKTEEQKAKGRNIEINNGRLAQIGLFAFFAESKVPGSVPFLKGLVPEYSGDYMIPFTGN